MVKLNRLKFNKDEYEVLKYCDFRLLITWLLAMNPSNDQTAKGS